MQLLKNIAGLHVRPSSNDEGSPGSQALSPGEGLLFQGLDAGVVHADADQCAALGAHSGGDLVLMEPERLVSILHTEAESLTEAPDSWGLRATQVFRSRFSGRGVRVAILDTGLDRGHPDFAEREIVFKSFVTDASIDDANGHGTYCAGLACGPFLPAQAARYGVAGNAELHIGKIIGDDGSGADGNILAGIDWAVRSGCDIVLLSAGRVVAPGDTYSRIFEQVTQRALAARTLIIAAAGNGSLRPDFIAAVDHPANCPSILAIAAVDTYLRIAPFCCAGVNTGGGEVGMAAPGVGIRSAWPRPALYRTHSGTSMASSYVAGIAALIAEANPSVRGRELWDLLRQTARRLGLPSRDVGAGLVQAAGRPLQPELEPLTGTAPCSLRLHD